MRTGRLVVYGDFNCPWSYLAARRAAVLAADGVDVDWRTVEHDPRRAGRFRTEGVRFDCLREETERVVAALLPDEELPYSLAGFVPYTRAAGSGYAEAYAAGVAGEVRALLFEAFWLHGIDLDDARIVRTLLVDAIRSGHSPSALLREWGYAVDVTGGPVSTPAWRLVVGWAEEWRALGKETVPVLLVPGEEPAFGADAVDRLGAELLLRGLDPAAVPRSEPAPAPMAAGDLASLSWVSQHGNRWLRAFRDAHRVLPFRHAG